MCDTSFYICKHCGNLIGVIHNSGVPMVCCGENMQRLEANTVEASAEKHLPVASIDGDALTVNIGSAAHPMAEEHHIEWVYLQTETGGQRKCLAVGAEPKATFALGGDKPIAVYAYCNLHGLWMTNL